MTDQDSLLLAAERLGATLEGSGVPRMPARVFAYVLVEDRDRCTARDLAEGLRVSPAAISGAVRHLVEARMLIRERNPGGRGDVFGIGDGDVWATILAARTPIVGHLADDVREAMELVPAGSAGRARLEETLDFFEFARFDLQGMLDRWRAFRAQRVAERREA